MSKLCKFINELFVIFPVLIIKPRQGSSEIILGQLIFIPTAQLPVLLPGTI
jgi:hypothetical protein